MLSNIYKSKSVDIKIYRHIKVHKNENSQNLSIRNISNVLLREKKRMFGLGKPVHFSVRFSELIFHQSSSKNKAKLKILNPNSRFALIVKMPKWTPEGDVRAWSGKVWIK